MLELSLLGAVRAQLDNRPIARFYSAKTQALLVYLAVESAEAHPRARLTGLLWPEFSQPDANNSLRQALFQLKKSLDNQRSQILRVSQEGVQINTENLSRLDVNEFLDHLQQGNPERAVNLYRGPFLDGFHVADSYGFEDWTRSIREHLHQQAINALIHLTLRARENGDFASAQHYATQTLALEPCQEEAHRSLMWVLALQGQRSAALAQYARCQQILDAELGVAPEPETTHLYEQIVNGGLHQPQPLRVASPTPPPALAPSPHGPVRDLHLPPLVGRRGQLAQVISRIVDPHCRLLSLTGLGGVGKTRLALAAAQELAENPAHSALFPHGIWLAPLLTAKTTEGALGVVAQALGLTLYGDRTIEEQVIAHLRPRKLLLLLDNCEHLPDIPAWVARLMAGAPTVKLLATSQEALNLWDEWLFPLEGLPVSGQSVTDPNILAGSPAVALFVLHARRRNPTFQLEADAASVLRICRLVAGLPLAIELAASWLPRMTCRQIAEQIEADLDFLATAATGIAERHRSIRAVLGQTWKMLSPPERDAVGRLAIFRGSFPSQAAQCVAGADLPLLGRLMEKTLLKTTGAGRYQMHELVRRFAHDHLARRPQEYAAALARHSDYFLAFIAQRREEFFSAVQKETLAAVDREFENVLAAWQWAVEHRRLAPLDQAQESIFAFCLNRGRYREGVASFAALAQTAQQAIADRTTEPDTEVEAGVDVEVEAVLGRALARQGFFTVSSGGMEEGMAMMRAALEIARRQQRPADLAFCLCFLGEFEGWRGNYDDAHPMLQESIRLYQTAGDLAGEGFALYRLGELTHTVGKFAQARAIFQRCVAISRQADSPEALGYALDQLAYCHLLVGDLDEADESYAESLRLFSEVGNELGMALASTGMGAAALARGGKHLAVALARLEESLVRARRIGHPIHIPATLSVMGLVLIARSDFAQAQPVLEEGLGLARQVDFGRGMMTSLNGLAQIAWETGNLSQARTLLTESLSRAVETGLLPLQAEVLLYWAQFRIVESQIAASATERSVLVDQAVRLLTLVVQDMPIQYIYHQQAKEMLAQLVSTPAESPSFPPIFNHPGNCSASA